MRRATTSRPVSALILLGILAFVSLMVTILLAVAIWPGEAKLTAPLFCDDVADPVVVSDTYSVQPGETSTNFTLYCLGPRGEADNVGYMRPFLALWGAHTLIIVVLIVVLALLRGGLVRRPSSDSASPSEPETASGFPVAPPPP